MVATNREAIAKQTNKKVRITLAHTESYIYTYIYSYRLHDLNPRDKILSSSVQLETGQIKTKHILTCSYDVNIVGAEQFHKKTIYNKVKAI